MKLTIHALSSSGGNYPVEFSDDSGVLRAFCHCQAGSFQQMCKHKLALLKGDRRMLSDPGEENLLEELLSSSTYPALRLRLDEYEKQLAEVEREIGKLKEREKNLKANFAAELAQVPPQKNKDQHHV